MITGRCALSSASRIASAAETAQADISQSAIFADSNTPLSSGFIAMSTPAAPQLFAVASMLLSQAAPNPISSRLMS